jgi:hypothetical protein
VVDVPSSYQFFFTYSLHPSHQDSQVPSERNSYERPTYCARFMQDLKQVFSRAYKGRSGANQGALSTSIAPSHTNNHRKRILTRSFTHPLLQGGKGFGLTFLGAIPCVLFCSSRSTPSSPIIIKDITPMALSSIYYYDH